MELADLDTARFVVCVSPIHVIVFRRRHNGSHFVFDRHYIDTKITRQYRDLPFSLLVEQVSKLSADGYAITIKKGKP